jgi:hypothetical protein
MCYNPSPKEVVHVDIVVIFLGCFAGTAVAWLIFRRPKP